MVTPQQVRGHRVSFIVNWVRCNYPEITKMVLLTKKSTIEVLLEDFQANIKQTSGTKSNFMRELILNAKIYYKE
jgi:hypothetical protein